MKKIIHHMRNQPEEVRRHILHVLTVVAGCILLFLWVYSLGATFSSPDTQAKINNDLKPFSALKSNLIEGYQDISNQNQP
jgi:hypothetical protein